MAPVHFMWQNIANLTQEMRSSSGDVGPWCRGAGAVQLWWYKGGELRARRAVGGLWAVVLLAYGVVGLWGCEAVEMWGKMSAGCATVKMAR